MSELGCAGLAAALLLGFEIRGFRGGFQGLSFESVEFPRSTFGVRTWAWGGLRWEPARLDLILLFCLRPEGPARNVLN